MAAKKESADAIDGSKSTSASSWVAASTAATESQTKELMDAHEQIKNLPVVRDVSGGSFYAR